MCGLFGLEGANVSQNLVDLSQSQATATAAVGTMGFSRKKPYLWWPPVCRFDGVPGPSEILPNSTGSYDEAKGTVTVAVTAGQVSWQPRDHLLRQCGGLVLADIASPLEVSASEADGAVELAYAAANALPDNESLALLTFQVKTGATGDTEIRFTAPAAGRPNCGHHRIIAVALAHKCPPKPLLTWIPHSGIMSTRTM